jgi:peptidyl-prolyl cis-trans isomerase C
MNQSRPEPAQASVRVGDTPISEADIAREMQHHRADDPRLAREAAARALVVRELLRLEVERLALSELAQPQAGETHEEACARVLLEREVFTPHPDESACRRYFASNRDRLRHPDRVLLRHILLAAAPADAHARSQARELGEELIDQLRKSPERFAELAERHSACPSRETGGELGWIEAGDTTPEFERQVFRLDPGLAGLTVESSWGHHVVYVDAAERGEPLDYPQAVPKIAAYLETQAKQQAIHEYLNNLARRYAVQGLEESTVAP